MLGPKALYGPGTVKAEDSVDPSLCLDVLRVISWGFEIIG